jgi:transposase
VRPRIFTGEYKQRVLAEADKAKESSGGIGALLRREGLYSSHLVTWRHERAAGILHALTPQKRGPKSKRSPLGEELRKAEIVIDIQKKVTALLGRPFGTTDREPQL